MNEYNGDLLLADEKIGEGTDWSDTMSIPVAGEKMTFGFSLLEERVLRRIQNHLPMEEFQKYRRDDMSDDHKRLLELQRKDDLTDDEEDELIALAEEVNPEDEGRDSLPDGAVGALMDAGVEALEPTDEDVTDIMNAPPDVQERVFGKIPDHLDKERAREQLREYMQERIEAQPFPIKFSLGQRAYMETVSVMGNGFQNT